MSHERRPLRKHGESATATVRSVLTRVTGALKNHIETWPRRYVELRVEALDGRDRER